MTDAPTDRDQVVELPTAGVPADHGLSSLGLLLQLGGSVLAALAALAAAVVLISMKEYSLHRPAGGALWLVALFGTCVARSLFMRQAGTELLYGSRTQVEGPRENPLGGLRRYVAIALGHTALVAVLARVQFHAPALHVLAYCAALAAWPLTLVAIFATGRLSRFKTALPISEDKGFEGASILMAVLGVTGAIATGGVLVLQLKLGSQYLLHGAGILTVIVLAMLTLRSFVHVQAGISGLRETSVDRSVELANRYASFGVISSLTAGGAWMLVTMTARLELGGFVLVAGMCWILMIWPLIIRRFFSDRQFADLYAGDSADIHRRAPDAGLTGLGWLLVCHAVLVGSLLVPDLVLGSENVGMEARKLMLLAMPTGTHSIWWNAGLVMLQAWTGYELIMRPQQRKIAIGYGVVATIVTLHVMWPIIGHVLDRKDVVEDESTMTLFAAVALQLALPISTLLLVTRSIAPTARARYRRSQPTSPSESTT